MSEPKPNKSKRIAVVAPRCVSCGTCIKSCPLDAISIPKGIIAVVDPDKCVGCGKCAAVCPAGIISIQNREEGGL